MQKISLFLLISALALGASMGVALLAHPYIAQLHTTTATFEDNPQAFEFILFPKDTDTPVFADQELTKPIGILNRAVGASYEEIYDGVVGVNYVSEATSTFGYVRFNSLAYLPPEADDSWVTRWHDYFKSREGVDKQWHAKQSQDGLSIVEYTIDESAIGRFTTFSYETDGPQITRVFPVTQQNDRLFGDLYLYDFFVFGLAVAIIALVLFFGRRFFR